MSQERKFFSGNTLEQALLQAARFFEVEPEEVAYELLEKKHGFLRTRRRVVIKVDPAAPSRPAAEGKRGPEVEWSGERKSEEKKQGSGTRQARKRPEPGPEWSETAKLPPAEPSVRASAKKEPVASRSVVDRPPGLPSVPQRWSKKLATPEEIVSAGPAQEMRRELAPPPPEPPSGEPDERLETVVPDAEQPRRPRRRRGRRRGRHEIMELPEGPRRALERFEPAQGELAEAAREALERLFELSAVSLEAEVLQGEDGLEIELWGPDQDLLLEDRGRLLLAYQHLLPRMIRGLAGRSTACRVDSDNFHEIRAERLRDMAQQVASKVQREGRSETLEPMSPDERRIVHLTLADDPTVETVSRGQGLFKRVTVNPVGRGGGRRPRGFDPYPR